MVSFQTRSPKLIVFCLVCIYCDCMLNTITLANPHDYGSWATTCDVFLFDQVIFFYGFLGAYFLRMWRIYRLYSLYEKYLR